MKITENLDVAIAHRLGNKDRSDLSLLVKFADSVNKFKGYQHAKNLKEFKNEEGNTYFVSDQLPDAQEELKRKLTKIKLKCNVDFSNMINSLCETSYLRHTVFLVV